MIGAGDFASMHHGLEKMIGTLRRIEAPTVLVAGNNETAEELRRACSGWPAAMVLHGDGIEIDGHSFFGLGGGVPVTPWGWSFDLTEQEAEQKLASCPEGGVLVVHSPPKGFVDGRGGRHLGSEAILQTIELRHPRVVVCGHVHECWGEEAAIASSRVINLGPDGVFIDL